MFLSLALVIPIVTATLLASASSGDDAKEDSLFKYLSVYTEVLGLARQNYVDRTDLDALMSASLDGATDALDPFSLYVPREGVESYETVRRIGASRSGLMVLKQNGVAFAVGVQPGSPAAEAGVQLGDIIGKVNGEATRLMPLWQIQQNLTGKPGGTVTLDLLRLGERYELSFELAEFDAPAPQLREEQGQAVLRIPSFDGGTVAGVEQALRKAVTDGRQGLLIDLRGVPGGDAEIAYQVAGLFTRGELGQLRRRGKTVETFSGKQAPLWQGKLVVLTDRGTVGAAEVLATVLREKVSAELVGQRTFGYAGRLGQAELSTGGRLIFTEAFFTGPSGEPLREGLVPDLRVDDRSRSLAESETPVEDLILERGLSVLSGDTELTPAQKAA